MMRKVARDRSSASATPCKSPRTNAMSAAASATSVPEPIAMPTSAAAKAGASLIPSPTIATRSPLACRSRTNWTFPSGVAPATVRSMPTVRATASTTGARSPLNRTTLRPICRSLATAAAAQGLTSSSSATNATANPSTDRTADVRAWASASRSACAAGSRSTPSAASHSGRPARTAWPSTVASTPMPGIARAASASTRRTPCVCSAFMTIAWASGCSERRCTAIARRHLKA